MKKKKKIERSKVIGLFIISALFLIVVIVYGVNKLFSREYYEIVPKAQDAVGMVKGYEVVYEKKGWLQVQGTSISLPVLYQAEKNYPVELQGYSWLTDYSPGFHNHFEIMGHNIFNLSSSPEIESNDFLRFEQLMAFVYYDFAKENKYIQLSYEGKEYLYKIFMVGFIPTADTILLPPGLDYTEEDMQEYISRVKSYSIYDYRVDVSKNDKILSLGTCTRFYGNNNDWEFFVVGRLVRNGERVDNYSVSKNDQYVKVEEKLKGSEENEEM
ncbi:MAG: class B sortase [Bacilli bacterium]|nr:class B sortase [Bacilli bacterium]